MTIAEPYTRRHAPPAGSVPTMVGGGEGKPRADGPVGRLPPRVVQLLDHVRNLDEWRS